MENEAKRKIYMDNASTTFPKPDVVAEEMYRYMKDIGVNLNRGGYEKAYEAEELVYETRELICELFHGDDLKNVVFTNNVTEGLNILVKGLLEPGDHVLVSSMEHNALMRPLVQLEEMGCTFSRVPCDPEGNLIFEEMEPLVKENTRAFIMLHGSNVCGTLLPIKEVGDFCKKHSLYFIVDVAQTAGVCPINMQEIGADAIAFTGHKGLLGPQGIGGFVLRSGMEKEITPLLSGGTGSISHTEQVPDFMPDRYEPGTMNLPGIAGLRGALLWLKETGIEKIAKHEQALTEQFLQGLKPLEDEGKIKIIGKKDTSNRIGVVSIQTTELDIAAVAHTLDKKYNIMTRVGLHCAPAAHITLGTYPTGTIRFSFGWFNTTEEVDAAIAAIKEICHGV